MCSRGAIAHLSRVLALTCPPSPSASHAAYKWDYWPHEDVRAECRFVGLTNLGATCYLASTIQQLYMIPEARQAVFTAKVRPIPGSCGTPESSLVLTL